MSSKVSRKSISSRVSRGGLSLFPLPDGPWSDPAGPEVLPASPSAPRENIVAKQTSGTSGPRCEGSSGSADLQLSLENRLRLLLDVNGSREYELTWKHWDIGSPPLICALRASVPRRSDSASSGWPTPVANPPGGSAERFLERKRKAVQRGSRMGVSLTDLGMTAKLAGWPTPTSKEEAGGEYKDPQKALHRVLGNHSNDLRDFAKLAGKASTGSPASMGSNGVLNPALSLWLMGFPSDWLMAAPAKTSQGRKSSRG